MDNSQRGQGGEFKLWTWRRILALIVVAVGYGYGMLNLFAGRILSTMPGDTAYLAFLVLVPFGIGALSAYTIPPEQRTTRRVISLAFVTMLLFLITSVIMMQGIFLCVLMIAPFVLVPALIGAWLVRGRSPIGREKDKRHYVFAGFVLVLPLLFAPIEAGIDLPNWERTVEDAIIIHGTPENVWQHIIRMDEIYPQEQRPSVYHALGIPRPVRATLDQDGIGGIRRGEFEYGLLFYEEITVWQPWEEVRFSVEVHQNSGSTPVLKQIGGRYFDILEAGYRIEQVDADRVVLHLDGTYRLSTHFNFYGAFWVDWIMHDFQRYVLNTVKQRVEAEA